MSFQEISIGQIKPNPRNARTHSAKQVRQIANSIIAFGFTNPVLVGEDGELLAGHGRYAAAKLLGLDTVPAVVVAGLSPARQRALGIADNKLAQNARWNRELLAIEIPELAEVLGAEGLDISILGFEPIEIDHLQTEFEVRAADPQDTIDPKWWEASAVSKAGDLWVLGNNKILCGDACSTADIDRLMSGGRADLAFLDPLHGQMMGPSGTMAAEDMASPDLVGLLGRTLGAAAAVSREGAVHLVGTDWRHLAELMAAAEPIYGEAVNLVVWVKSSADQGFVYRNQHEFIGVFRVGNTPPATMAPGRRRRSRSDVWHYAAVKPSGAMGELHRSAKPVALVADAITDSTRTGDIVLDTFAGLGTTVMAAERIGRHARGLEAEPRLVDVAIRRWQAFTGGNAVHAESGLSFAEIAAR